ncbi:hypothetical protein HYH03_010545 [Edaphochlamys debaryana]|uniref:BACK domain-containing protein n=1 Tax=Edaphochlamys debaryana TaxID=47281 RepID=A0A835XVT3_9CHLO|nr:hypothetical protein HYH03_010545 [Edaphochlamys debaryana]|eukprot:KAG2491101.1 hypothetical protein HYH03_010545 [Edaphochlamys debaryana]
MGGNGAGGEDGAITAAPVPAEPKVFGSPLPAHTLVLEVVSGRFAAQIQRWGTASGGTPRTAAQPEPAADGADPSASSSGAGRKRPHPAAASAPDGRPVLRVPVADEAEAEAGRLAIRFAYTGEVQPCSIRQALETLRVADYLEIKGCGAACADYIAQQLSAAGEASGSTAGAADPPVLHLYSCSELWPDRGAEPAFAAVVEAAEPALIRHFGDALAALNRPALREQLLKLPAAGVEALLESEAFGTDSEDSILTLLATWMRANRKCTDPASRKRLSGLVRLAQLSRHAASCLLLPLSVDYEGRGEAHPAGWFPVSTADALLVGAYASAQAEQQASIRGDLPFPSWCNMKRRPQCLPAAGLGYGWASTREQLQAALAESEDEGETAWVYPKFDGGQDTIVAAGLAWQVVIKHETSKGAAGLYLHPTRPAAYHVEGSRLAPGGSHHSLELPVNLTGRILFTCRRGGGPGSETTVDLDHEDPITLNVGYGRDYALRLAPVNAGVAAGGAAAAADPLASWAPYLHEGKIGGSVVLLPAEDEEEEEGEEEEEEEESDDTDSDGN